MRGKRSKQYKKLMQQYGMSFGFREPYQVLVDAEIIRDADRFKMDLVAGLERTLHGQVKPMITQCSMRHLYAAAKEPGVSFLIDKAKLFERRRCNHLPEDYPEPLSTRECLSSVVDPKGSATNKHRYVVASQELETRKALRSVMGVPLVYINRSVMIMEPMAEATVHVREQDERGKFRQGLKSGRASGSLKRKREEDGNGPAVTEDAGEEEAVKKKKKKSIGPKGPNPLAVRKPKKKVEEGTKTRSREVDSDPTTADNVELVKKKRRRKHKSGATDSGPMVEADADGDD